MSLLESCEPCGSNDLARFAFGDTPGGISITTIAHRWQVWSSAGGIPPGVYFGDAIRERVTRVQVDENAVGDVIKRLRRAEGQIRGVIAMLESGRDCSDVVTQLAAVSKALDRAGFKIIASGLQQCLTAAEDGEDQTVNLERMEKLFLSLA